MALPPASLFDATRAFVQAVGRLESLEQDIVLEAFYAATAYHGQQRRKSGEPYIIHPIQVALILSGTQQDVPTLVAGLLHDTLEDTAATPVQLRRLFGDEASALVEAITRFPMHSRKEFQEKIYDKAVKDHRIACLKLADTIGNLMPGSQSVFPLEKHLAHLEEAEEHTAKRLAALPGVPASLQKLLRSTLDSSWEEYHGRMAHSTP